MSHGQYEKGQALKYVFTRRQAPTKRSVGDVTVDASSRRAWVGSRELDLRPKEFDLLAFFTSRPGRALRREEVMGEVWDENWWGSTKTLDIHIAALRRKLGEQSDETSRIATLRGVGYRFEGR